MTVINFNFTNRMFSVFLLVYDIRLFTCHLCFGSSNAVTGADTEGVLLSSKVWDLTLCQRSWEHTLHEDPRHVWGSCSMPRCMLLHDIDLGPWVFAQHGIISLELNSFPLAEDSALPI